MPKQKHKLLCQYKDFKLWSIEKDDKPFAWFIWFGRAIEVKHEIEDEMSGAWTHDPEKVLVARFKPIIDELVQFLPYVDSEGKLARVYQRGQNGGYVPDELLH